MKRCTSLVIAIIVVSFVIGMFGGEALASAQCTAVGGIQSVVPSECVINTPITTPCPFTLTLPAGEDLRMTSGGSISCNDTGAPPNSAQNITIVVDADMVMEAGSAIRAENNNNGGSGGNINITVSGDFTMRGPSGATPGAVISSRKTAGAGDTGVGGNITIKVGNVEVVNDVATCDGTPAGDTVVETGAVITANSTGQAGTIKMFGGKDIIINGQVLSQGIGTAKGEGGPITIDACCDLIIGDTGVVSSRGADPGADLVHLEACCVFIFGLVESTGAGHEGFNNLCNVNRPGKPANSTGCIEVWAGDEITIDATGTHKGQLNADVGTGGGIQGSSWIDVLAHKLIRIFGNATPPAAGTNNDTNPPYAIHANMPLQNGHGGDITVISTDRGVTTSGRAIQANSSTLSNGGKGGHIQVLAHDAVAFGTAFIQAAGDTSGGGSQQGGTILGHSFNVPFKVTGAAPGQLNATGPGGTVTLHGCGQVAADYTGTVIGALNIDPTCTGGNPPLPVPANTLLPAIDCELTLCLSQPVGSKRGVKFNDVNGNGVRDPGDAGLPGWTIHIFNTAGTFHEHLITQADGSYTSLTLGPDTYTVCEELQAGFTQTFPTGSTTPPAGESIATTACQTHTHLGNPGPFGYTFTITGSEQFLDNDFGNFTQVVCPEDPNRAPLLTRAVDSTLTPHGGLPVYATVNEAYAAAVGPNEVIGMFSNTTENVVLNGTKSLIITQCTLARVTAEFSGQPVWKLSSTGKLTVIGPDAVGGTIGWLVETSGHELRGLRATGASQFGALIQGNGNSVAFNTVSGSTVGVGIRIEGTGHDVRGGTVFGNGVGVQVAGSGNKFRTANVQNNNEDGIVVEGTGNTVRDNGRVNNNGKNGVLVTGSGNTILNNAAGSDKGKGNVENGFKVTGANNLLDSNKANANLLNGFHIVGGGTKLKNNQSNQGPNGACGPNSKENCQAEYQLDVNAVNQGGNKADAIGIPKVSNPQKCPTFPSAGTCE